MNTRLAIALTASLIVSVGCRQEPPEVAKPLANHTNYELVSAGNGTVYRLDKSSGEVAEIVGNQFRKVIESGDPSTNSIRVWETKIFAALGNAHVDMKTRLSPWSTNKMQYSIRIGPASEIVRKNCKLADINDHREMRVVFQDAAGFRIHHFEVNMHSFGFSEIKDDSGNVVALESYGYDDCSYSVYWSLKDWSCEIEVLKE